MGDELALISYKLLRILASGFCFLIHLKFQFDLVLERAVSLSSFYFSQNIFTSCWWRRAGRVNWLTYDEINMLKGRYRDLVQNTC